MGTEGGFLSLQGWLGVGVLTLIVLWLWKVCRAYQTFTSMGVKGPKPLPLLGNMLDTRKGVCQMLSGYTQEYGKLYGYYYFTKPILVVSDLDMLREIMVKKFHYFPNRMMQQSFQFKPWKDLLSMLKDDHWKHVRGQLSPTFSSGKIKKMMPAIQRVAVRMTDYFKTLAEKGEPIELKEMSGRFAMDVIAAATYSIDVDSLHNPEQAFVKHALVVLKPSKLAVFLMLATPKLFLLLSRYGFDFGLKESMEFFIRISQEAARERQNDTQQQTHRDFLQLLMEAEKEGHKGPVDAEINHGDKLQTSATWTRQGLTEDEIHANTFLFLLAGYEGISYVLSLTLFLLANNPHCLHRAQQEVDQILGQKTVDYDTATQLNYLDLCVNETMRLYPSGFILSREASDDVEVNGVKVKKGMDVVIPVRDIHRDPLVWPDPDTFDPMRHTAEAKAARHPFAFLPFGMGPRNCIGMRLAQIEVRMALASVLQHFSPVPCEKTVYPPKLAKLRQHAVDGLWVKLQSRS